MGSSTHSSLYRPDIDGLRAVAVISVIAYHLGVPGFGGGYVGVDVFFVISGFLITRLILVDMRRGTFSFVKFMDGEPAGCSQPFILCVWCHLLLRIFCLHQNTWHICRGR